MRQHLGSLTGQPPVDSGRAHPAQQVGLIIGPRQVLAEALAGLGGIEAAYLFGSWAARYAGQEGRAPVDLDVLVIGRPDRDELDEAAQQAGARLAREVNVTIRTPQWWREADDAFHAEVTRRPLVPILEPEGLI